MSYNHHPSECCSNEGPIPQIKLNQRKILVDNILYYIQGSGEYMFCTFENQVNGRTGMCQNPPQNVVERMNELRG
ncbi:MAG: hypothetical protein DWQ19_09885 [Crenarchaeota archaeon]|nr:MAG: hypothetical protein DWQ19_09885 [Thermoproteota archaeon]